MIEGICTRLQDCSQRVADAVYADFYQDPFWEARFGEKGQKYTRLDTISLLDYLQTAIRGQTASIFSNQVAWLRPMLVTRGLCTVHVEDTLTSLETHLRAELGNEWVQVQDCFALARQNLAYSHPTCLRLSELRERMARTALMKAGGVNAETLRDLRWYLSYWMDALEWNTPQIFSRHFLWYDCFLQERGRGAGHARQVLRALFETLSAELGDQAETELAVMAAALQIERPS